MAEFLADRCTYDKNTPVTPDGEDFVNYFLTESKQGYCMHFASAAALLLRELGYPARYVSGFTADVVRGRTTSVPDSAAHAWVEVYLEGYGWYPVEVTPSSSAATEPEDPTPTGSESSPEPTAPESETPTPTPSASVSPSQTPAASPSGEPGASQPVHEELPQEPDRLAAVLRALGQVLQWLTGAAAAALLLWLGQYLPKKLRARRLADPDANKAALYAYRCLTRLERWGGQVEEGAADLAQKARFSQHTLTGEERQAMAAYFDRQRRRVATTLSPVLRPLFRYLWGIPLSEEEPS